MLGDINARTGHALSCSLAFVRALDVPRRPSSPLDIDDILFRDRYALLREEMEVDRFLKWRGDNVRNIFPRIGMLFEPFEMRIIPFPSINMEFRAVAHPTPLLPPRVTPSIRSQTSSFVRRQRNISHDLAHATHTASIDYARFVEWWLL